MQTRNMTTTFTTIAGRARTLEADGYSIRETAVKGMFLVRRPAGSTGPTSYVVAASSERGHTCECKGFEYHGACKHLLAVEAFVKARAASARLASSRNARLEAAFTGVSLMASVLTAAIAAEVEMILNCESDAREFDQDAYSQAA